MRISAPSSCSSVTRSAGMFISRTMSRWTGVFWMTFSARFPTVCFRPFGTQMVSAGRPRTSSRISDTMAAAALPSMSQ